jgi:hypothetical protein
MASLLSKAEGLTIFLRTREGELPKVWLDPWNR